MMTPPSTLTNRLRNTAIHQVSLLWIRRKGEGWTQHRLALASGRDEAWISRSLRDTSHWSLKTIAILTHALDGDATLTIFAVEDQQLQLELAAS